MRLFVAVHFSDAVRESIRHAIDDFPVSNPPWRWTEPATWHITLKFIGEAAPADADRVIATLSRVAPAHAPFDLALAGFGGFPNLRAPRVLFYGAAAGAEECTVLAAAADAALFESAGLERETRRFHPHVTVARVKDRLPAAVAAQLPGIPPLSGAVTRVDRFALMESRLRRTGAEYSTVKEFALSRGR